MPRSRKAPLFELSGQWIGREPGSPFLHRYWTEPGTGRTRRSSLRTEDLEEAKRLLAEIVVKGAPKSERTPLSAVLLDYFENHTDKLPSGKNARGAGRTLLECWGQTIRVEAIKESKQKEFAEWSIERGHSLGYISRNLSVLAAAFSYAKINREVIFKEGTMVKKWALQAKARRKPFTPSDDELAKVLIETESENFWRWTVISLLTGARPEAALNLTPSQRNRDNSTIDLNPDGRQQNKKYRPTIREPRALTAWLDSWEAVMLADLLKKDPEADPATIKAMTYSGYASVESIQTAFERIRAKKTVALPKLSAYSYRHKIATVLRKARLPFEEREMQLGHRRPEGYGEWDPDYLQGCADALDAWWIKLQAKADAARRERARQTKQKIDRVRLFPVSEGPANAKLESAEVIQIRERIAAGEDNKTIAADFPVSHHEVNKIRRGKAWGGPAVDEPYDSLRGGKPNTPDKLPGGSK
jgi:integrase